jgi:hypothetical protein
MGMKTDEREHRVPSPELFRYLTWLTLVGFLCFAMTMLVDGVRHPYIDGFFSVVFYGSIFGTAAIAIIVRVADIARRRKWSRFDRWSYLPSITIVLAVLYLAIRIPFLFFGPPGITAGQAAHRAGLRAEKAMKQYYFQNHRYTGDLSKLTEIDPTIMEAPQVTFKFDQADATGYKFSAHYHRSPLVYRFSSKGIEIFKGMKAGARPNPKFPFPSRPKDPEPLPTP